MNQKPQQGLLSFFQKHPYAMVIVLWFFFQALWYLRFGFVFTLEAPKYVHEAEHILHDHHLSQFRFLFYFTTIAVIAFSLTIKTGLVGALLFIMVINLAAYLYFFSALQKFFRSAVPAFLLSRSC